jgi:hypothetical protein
MAVYRLGLSFFAVSSSIKPLGQCVTDELFFVMAITPVFLADARCCWRLSTTILSKVLRSSRALMSLGELRRVMAIF